MTQSYIYYKHSIITKALKKKFIIQHEISRTALANFKMEQPQIIVKGGYNPEHNFNADEIPLYSKNLPFQEIS